MGELTHAPPCTPNGPSRLPCPRRAATREMTQGSSVATAPCVRDKPHEAANQSGGAAEEPFPAYEGSCEPLLSARAKSTLEPLPSATFSFSQRTSPSRRERGSPEILVAPCLPFDSLRGQEAHEALVRLYLSKIPSLRHARVHSTFGSASMRVSEARTGPVSSRGGKEGRRSNGETASGHTKLPLHAAGSTPTAEAADEGRTGRDGPRGHLGRAFDPEPARASKPCGFHPPRRLWVES